MGKIVVILLLTALAILMARLVYDYDAPVIQTRVGELIGTTAPAPVAPPLMYAGIRG